MTNDELLEGVKAMLGASGNDALDATLNPYINEIIRFCKSAGVPQSVIDSDSILGIVARGVSDLWNYGAGNVDYSEMFYKSLAQLRLEGADSDV